MESRASDKNVWLFNIAKDPNEHQDLSDSMPDMVMKMLRFLELFNSTAVKCEYPPDDPKADPKLSGRILGTVDVEGCVGGHEGLNIEVYMCMNSENSKFGHWRFPLFGVRPPHSPCGTEQDKGHQSAVLISDAQVVH